MVLNFAIEKNVRRLKNLKKIIPEKIKINFSDVKEKYFYVSFVRILEVPDYLKEAIEEFRLEIPGSSFYAFLEEPEEEIHEKAKKIFDSLLLKQELKNINNLGEDCSLTIVFKDGAEITVNSYGDTSIYFDILSEYLE